MMTNLFSIFDPSINFFSIPMNWVSLIFVMLFTPLTFWLVPTRFNRFVYLIIFTLHKEFKTLIGFNYSSGSTLMMISVFILILLNNFLGLFPYIFTSTSHISISLSLALPLWLNFMLWGWINNTKHMFTHLVPQGTPSLLMSFMVIIETISNLIRPMTLAVRLMANMVAGHLLITLLSSMNIGASYFLISILSSVMILLLILEMSVSVIQAYVFSILSTLYSSEVI